MQRAHRRVGLGGDDREGVELLAVGRPRPALPQPGQREELAPDRMDVERLLAAALPVTERLPLVEGVLSRNRRKFRQPINVACPAPGRWGRPNTRVTSRHFDHGNASRTSRPDCSGLDEAD